MWFIWGSPWITAADGSRPERVYKIAHATSSDGVEWTRDGMTCPIEDQLGPTECQALPTVIEISGKYHMIFCYRAATDFRTDGESAYRLGHAVSDDLLHWSRSAPGMNVPAHGANDWDAGMACYPHLARVDGKVFLLFNGNEFGRHGFGLARLDQE
jgi:hypothetical protein